MDIKELFDKAENGTLTYDQFMSAVTNAKAKFVDLTEGRYVDKQKYTDDLANRDTRITALDETIKTRDADLVKLQEQLKTAGTDADKLNELTNNFANLQKQYDKDTKAYAKQLKDQEYKFAVTEFASKQKFSSQAAKRDFINTMLSKNLQVENDTIIGATDFVAAYTKDNADAFIVDSNSDDSKPKFVDSTTNNSNNSGDSNPFMFDFVGVRPKPNK